MLLNVIVTMLIAGLIITVFCLRAYRADSCRRENHGYIVVPVNKDTKKLRGLVMSYYWEEVFSDEKCAREIVLVEMNDNEICEKAKELADEYSIVHYITAGELVEFLRKMKKRCDDEKKIED